MVASSQRERTQIMYANRNPISIDPKGNLQIRRLSRDARAEHPALRVRLVTEEDLCRVLDGLVDSK
ncbi:hypothetical protein [Streptomyces pseudogriseolus]|uniref:hypothetical protein n=1 Tax=Streptomyces pseudogriseolus TaxID=36817 RepID=UPI00348E1D0C